MELGNGTLGGERKNGSGVLGSDREGEREVTHTWQGSKQRGKCRDTWVDAVGVLEPSKVIFKESRLHVTSNNFKI